MSDYILNLETSAKVCAVALSNGPECIDNREYPVANSHSSVLTGLIATILEENKLKMTDLRAISISAGPGSYTGLRIGTSTAKGLCYALDIPLIAVSTLESMAWGAQKQHSDYDFYVPMIDARRMEVYTASYDKSLQVLQKPRPLIVDKNPYIELLQKGRVLFVGNGVEKCMDLLAHNMADYEIQAIPLASDMCELAHNSFIINKFEDVAYFEPAYIKAFWTTAKVIPSK
ncbi:MAG: tRNA threonylcarbamoyladenosine biosynthesis protein TsaB [Saprospiraceae bacterium]|jgi:tRNA threonylcarbamoyladenosine biosynthesis protein TsaB